MSEPKLSRLELQIMKHLWNAGPSSIREIHESFPKRNRPAYTTVQTMVYRLEGKGALKRTKKIGNAFILEAVISRASVQTRLLDELLGLFGGRAQPMMAHLVESGRITLEDIKEAEKALQAHAARDKKK
jgi:BlaI family transcriptional regulator, penicillinase repressor